MSDPAVSADVVSDPFCAVVGTLLHAGAWEALDRAQVAQRSALTGQQAQRALDRLVDMQVALKCPFQDGPRYRLTTAGVVFARELTGETPAAWR